MCIAATSAPSKDRSRHSSTRPDMTTQVTYYIQMNDQVFSSGCDVVLEYVFSYCINMIIVLTMLHSAVILFMF